EGERNLSDAIDDRLDPGAEFMEEVARHAIRAVQDQLRHVPLDHVPHESGANGFWSDHLALDEVFPAVAEGKKAEVDESFSHPFARVRDVFFPLLDVVELVSHPFELVLDQNTGG